LSNVKTYRKEKENIRKNFNIYTIKAFQLIPKIKDPKILDVGCGTGVPTIQLAKISKGQVIGIDIDNESLKILKEKIKDEKLTNKIRVVNESILNMDFPDEEFDIIWAEGSIFSIGYNNALKKWRRFLKQKGYLVIHDDIKDKNHKLEILEKYGFLLINQFDISYSIWWEKYYKPLKKIIQNFNKNYKNDNNLINEIHKDQIEIKEFKSDSKEPCSFFIITQKI
jgi:ubiquinone/menaquinone biosynthesis C-methylase UbiE